MNEVTPSRSNLLALKEERRVMQEGYVFLDEKCLLLAAAILRELRAYDELCVRLRAVQDAAGAALHAAFKRHGVQGLQCYPAGEWAPSAVALTQRSLLGVALQEATLDGAPDGTAVPMHDSPEARACRSIHEDLARGLVELAAHAGNLERLYREYRRTMRRAHALQDVLLPEVGRSASEMDSFLEEQERDEALWARRGIRTA